MDELNANFKHLYTTTKKCKQNPIQTKLTFEKRKRFEVMTVECLLGGRIRGRKHRHISFGTNSCVCETTEDNSSNVLHKTYSTRRLFFI